MFVLIVAMIGLGALAIGNFVRVRTRGRFRRRLGEYVTLPAEEVARERRAEISALLTAQANRPFIGTGWLRGFAADCELADIRTSPATLAFWALGGGVIAAALFALIFGSGLALFLGLLVPLGIRYYVSFKLARKRRAFGEQLPDNLDVLASALRAGYSLVAALSVVADDAPEPSRSELRRVIADEQLGASLDDAFEVCVRRMDNRDLEQVALVALLQREAGGNAAEVIDQVATNIRGRMELRRLVRTLTAQGRLARWIVSLLPVALFGAIFLINRDYLKPLWTETFGVIAMIIAAIMVISGSLAIKKIVNIKV
jgi:tight adherence protein B